jgi:hypothetical protein
MLLGSEQWEGRAVMRKLIVTVGVFVVGFVAGGVFLRGGPTTATAQGAPPRCSKLIPLSDGTLVSDANGDGRFDISDPVLMLNFLFLGGETPRSVCGGPLPATGVRKCYDPAAELEECPRGGSPFGGQDGFYQAGCPKVGRFVESADQKTITDTCTGLMWQKKPFSGDHLWEAGLSLCEDLELAGHDDWRLPNAHELHSLVDYGSPRGIYEGFASELPEPGAFFWTSSTYGLEGIFTHTPIVALGSFWFEYRTGACYHGPVTYGVKNLGERYSVLAVRTIKGGD